MMVVAGIESDRFVVERLRENVRGSGFERAANDEDRSFLADERATSPVFTRAAAAMNNRAAGVFEADIKLLWRFVELLRLINRVAPPLDVNRPAFIHAERPLSDV